MAGKHKREWKVPFFEGLCPTVEDWAQMAAYLDGEGSILINTQKRGSREARGFYLRITVANTDIRLMQWLKDKFGGNYKDANTAKYYEGKNWKRAYHWGTSSHRAAWILHNCLSRFVIKSEQAQLGIMLQENLGQHNFRGRFKSVPREVQESRKELKQRLLVLKAKGIN